MRIAFNTFLPICPVVSDPPAKTPKARELVAHVLKVTRIGEQAQAARQARRVAAGFNQTVQPTATAPVSRYACSSHNAVVAVASAAASGCG